MISSPHEPPLHASSSPIPGVQIWYINEHVYCGKCQGIYDGMTLDEIKNMDPEEHKVKEEHPFNYRYPRGEVMLVIFYLKIRQNRRGRNKDLFSGKLQFDIL